MLSFELWSFYFLKDGSLKTRLQNNLDFFLKLRSFWASFNTLEFQRLEKILQPFLKLSLSDIIGRGFPPLERRIIESANKPIVLYLRSLDLLPLPALVNIDSSFDRNTRFILVAARSFPFIEMIANFIGEEEESPQIWDLIRENIRIYDQFRFFDINILDLPNCQELFITDYNSVGKFRLPMLQKLDYNAVDISFQNTSLEMREIMANYPLKKLSINEYPEEILNLATSNARIQNFSVTLRKYKPIDFSNMEALKELEIYIHNLEKDEKLIFKLPPSLQKLSLKFRNTQVPEEASRIWVPAAPHLEIKNSGYEILVTSEVNPFLRMEKLTLSKFRKFSSIYIEEGLNPWVVLKDSYVERKFFNFETGESYSRKSDMDIIEVGEIDDKTWNKMELPNLRKVGVRFIDTCFLTDLYKSIQKAYIDIERFRSVDWSSCVKVPIRPSVKVLELRASAQSGQELKIPKLTPFIENYPNLKQILLNDRLIPVEYQKVIQYLVRSMGRNIEVLIE